MVYLCLVNCVGLLFRFVLVCCCLVLVLVCVGRFSLFVLVCYAVGFNFLCLDTSWCFTFLVVDVNSVVMYISFVYYTCGFPLCCWLTIVVVSCWFCGLGVVAFW